MLGVKLCSMLIVLLLVIGGVSHVMGTQTHVDNTFVDSLQDTAWSYDVSIFDCECDECLQLVVDHGGLVSFDDQLVYPYSREEWLQISDGINSLPIPEPFEPDYSSRDYIDELIYITDVDIYQILMPYSDIMSAASNLVTIVYRSTGHDAGSLPARHTLLSPGTAALRYSNVMRRWYAFGGWRQFTQVWPGNQSLFWPAGSHGEWVFYAHLVPGITFEYRSVGHTSGVVPAMHGVTPGNYIILQNPAPNLTRPGHVFAGWSNAGVRQPGYTFNFGALQQGHFVFDAHWAGPVTFQFRSVGHTSGTVPSNVSDFAPRPIALPGNTNNLSRPGYFFGGWRHGTQIWPAGHALTHTLGTQGTFTFYAHWIPSPNLATLHIPYEIYVSSHVAIAQAQEIMRQVKPAFNNTFRINFVHHLTRATQTMNPRLTTIQCVNPHFDGTCTPRCGSAVNGSDCYDYHHRSAWHALRQRYAGSGNRRVIRFVGHRMCFPGGSTGHMQVEGLAYRGRLDAVVTLWHSRLPLIATAHEISHILGARCGSWCTPNQLCPMNGSAHNIWCQGCSATIMGYRNTLSLSANDLAAFSSDYYSNLVYTPIPSEMVFSSLEEFVLTYSTALAGRAGDDIAILAESMNLSTLERLYMPTNIPSEYQLYRITVDENAVTLLYLHSDDLVTEGMIWDALINQRHFKFVVTRWDIDSPMAGILAQTESTDADLIDGRYLFIEPNMFIWSSDRDVIYMYTPLNPRGNSFVRQERGNDNIHGFDWVSNFEQIQLTETRVIDLLVDEIDNRY